MSQKPLQSGTRDDNNAILQLAIAITDACDARCFSFDGAPEHLYLRNGGNIMSWGFDEFGIPEFELCRFLKETVLPNAKAGAVLYFDEDSPIWLHNDS